MLEEVVCHFRAPKDDSASIQGMLCTKNPRVNRILFQIQ